MKIDVKGIVKEIRHLSNNARLAIGMMALSVPLVQTFIAARFVSEPNGALLVIVLFITALMFTGWLVCQFPRSPPDRRDV